MTRDANVKRAPGARILLVDDRPANLLALEAILEPLGEPVLRASSGREAIAIASRVDLAVVLLALGTPERAGFETAARLRRLPRGRGLPIVILTARDATAAEIVRGYGTGAVEFLFEPLDPEILSSKVAFFVDLFRQRFVRRADRRFEALVRIQRALTDDRDPARMAEGFIEELTAATGSVGGIIRYEAHGRRAIASSGVHGPDLEALARGDPAVTLRAGSREPLRLRRTPSPLAPSRLLESVLVVPLLSRHDHVEGIVALAGDRPDATDEELAVVAAQHAAASFENARLYEAASAARHRAERAELAMAAADARLRLALDAVGLGTWEYDPTTAALRADDRCRLLLACGDDLETLWRSAVDGGRERLRSTIEASLATTTTTTWSAELRAAGTDGHERWIAARWQSVVERGRAVRLLGTVLDVSARVRVEDERTRLLAETDLARRAAEAASQAKDEFLATVSHELRTPLNAIVGWAHLLVDDLPTAGSAAELLHKGCEVIARNAQTQVRLVDDVLDVARIVNGRLHMSMDLVDLGCVARSLLDAIRPAVDAKGLDLESQIGADRCTVLGDEDRLRQVLWNLLANALKFTSHRGRIRFSLERDGDLAAIAVADDGEGIEPAFLPHVFDRFRQADGSSTRPHGGLGIGLSIVRHLVELQGGTVCAESEGRGRGATFRVYLPIHDAGEWMSTGRDGRDAAQPVRLSGRNLLVLDDHADMRDLVAAILEDAGASVVRTASGREALRAMYERAPEAVVADVSLPVEDGLAFARRVRQADRDDVRDVPLIALTARAHPDDRRRVLAAGFQRHVVKPIAPKELVAIVASVVDG